MTRERHLQEPYMGLVESIEYRRQEALLKRAAARAAYERDFLKRVHG